MYQRFKGLVKYVPGGVRGATSGYSTPKSRLRRYTLYNTLNIFRIRESWEQTAELSLLLPRGHWSTTGPLEDVPGVMETTKSFP